MMAGIETPEDHPPDPPNSDELSEGLPRRGRRTPPGSVPEGFEPLTAMERAVSRSPDRAAPKAQKKPPPRPEPPAVVAAAPPTIPEVPPAPTRETPTPPASPFTIPTPSKTPATDAELAAKRESRSGRAYSQSRPAKAASGASSARVSVPAGGEELARARAEDRPAVGAAPTPADPPPSPSPTGDTSRPSRRVLAGVAVGAVLAVTVAAVFLGGTGDDSSDDAASAPSPVTPTDVTAPVSQQFQPPMDLTSDTEYIETEVVDSDTLLVTHWIRSSTPMDELSVTVPAVPELEGKFVEVTDLVVAADGVQVDPPESLASGASWDGLSAARDLYVQYELFGTLQRNGSTPGRALATVTSLDVGVASDVVSRTQTFPGPQALALACLAPGTRPLPRPCGGVEEGTWTVVLEESTLQDTVIVQLDLGEI